MSQSSLRGVIHVVNNTVKRPVIVVTVGEVTSHPAASRAEVIAATRSNVRQSFLAALHSPSLGFSR